MSMTDTVIERTPAPATLVTPALAVLSGWITFALIQFVGARLAGGFDYPLDDPYIHLAIAETIASGGYGVNAGELSSPGSSPLYPLLLLPFNGTELHRFMPLAWNLVGLTLVTWLWGRLLAEAGWCRRSWRALGIALAVVGPFAFMMPMVAAVGMEHSLHAAAALAVVLGLHRHVSGRDGTLLILVAAFLGTALRLEGLALGLLAGAALMLSGRRGGGAAVMVAAVLPLAIFAATLMALGLDPAPSSVQAKLALTGESEMGFLTRRVATLLANLRDWPGLLIAVMAVAVLFLSRLAPRLREGGWSLFGGVIVLAALAHLAFGQIGWLHRYEHYILVVSAAGLMALLPKAYGETRPDLRAHGLVALTLAGGLAAYQTPKQLDVLVKGMRAIHLQQAQMATFAKDFLDRDVAVNDLGWVAFQNPNDVLDLWGLASAKARTRRLENPSPGWTGELTNAAGVPAAMVYDHWFDAGLGTDWVRLGRLVLTVEGGFLGGYEVAFYATGPAHVPMMQDAIAAWEPTLRAGSAFVWDEGMAP